MRKTRTRFNWLDKVAALSATEKLKSMLWPLAYHADLIGECHPSVTTLAKESGCGERRTAQRRLRHLELKGLIQIVHRCVPFHTHGRTLFVNKYRLTLPKNTPERRVRVVSCHPSIMTCPDKHNDVTKSDNDVTKQPHDVSELCHINPNRSQLLKPILKAEEKEAASLSVPQAHTSPPLSDKTTASIQDIVSRVAFNVKADHEPEPTTPEHQPAEEEIIKSRNNLEPFKNDLRKCIGFATGKAFKGKHAVYDQAMLQLSPDTILNECAYVIAWKERNASRSYEAGAVLTNRLKKMNTMNAG